MTGATYLCQHAYLPGGTVARDVVVEVADGRITAVETGHDRAARGEAPATSHRLTGLVVPGAANAHSHAFHRALRGRTHGNGGTFWTWREQMYAVASRLDPDSYHELARAVFAEMALAGFTSVGEFHYLHHGPDGTPYDDRNATGHALVAAAAEAGIRIALLDTCYLAGGIGRPLESVQRRFGDGDADGWRTRVDDLARHHAGSPGVVVGAAIHSVRAVPRDQLPTVASWAASSGAPLHAHVSEQPAENDACLAAYGRTPVAVLDEAGALGRHATAVHATHLTDDDVATLARTATAAGFCPTTERDLGDGIGPAAALVAAGVDLTLGTDGHASIDAFEEARAVEMNTRLATLERGCLDVRTLLAALTENGHARLGFPDAGRIEVGARADLVAVRLDSVRTAGATVDTAAASVVFGATAADVTDVVVDGRVVVSGGEHVLGDVGRLLHEAIGPLTLDG